VLSSLVCSDCGRAYPARLDGTCDCGGILLARYSSPSGPAPGSGGLWSWGELLPECEPVTLGEAETPLRRVDGAWVKDDSPLPTATFKARGAAVGVAMARALGARGVALPSAGNAGAAWAAYCAAAGLSCAVWMTEDAPSSTREAAAACGAEIVVVPGSIAEASPPALAAAAERGWHFAGTFREPWRVEGKKTSLFEVACALGWNMPDAAVLPVGGGVGLVAWHKAAGELRAAGWASGSTRLYAVQSAGCAPVVRSFERGADDVEPWEDPRTVAAGIRIPRPLAGRLVLRALRESGGGVASVEDSAIHGARAALAEALRIEVAPEAAAAWAGYEALRDAGAFRDTETVVVYLTGGSPQATGTKRRAR
jgi:threonine synthase